MVNGIFTEIAYIMNKILIALDFPKGRLGEESTENL